MSIGRHLTSGFAILALAASPHPAPAEPVATRSFRIFLPAFSGEQPLGLNVATVVNLRLWRTLRKAPTPNPSNLDFGSGTVVWDTGPMREPAIALARTAMRFTHSDMVLLGSAERYGEGVIAATTLVVRPLNETDAPRGAVWRIVIGGRKIDLGLPRHIFEFGTMALRPEVVASFSKPSALMLCPTQTTRCAGKPLGPKYEAGEHAGDWTFVRSSAGGRGWVHLDRLGEEPNETVEFTGGLTSYFRGDMEKAEELFGKAAATAAADSIAREDARILSAASRSRFGKSASAEIAGIREEDPYSRYALQVAVMDALHNYSANRHGARQRLPGLAANVRESRGLFEAGDPWLASADAIFESLGI